MTLPKARSRDAGKGSQPLAVEPLETRVLLSSLPLIPPGIRATTRLAPQTAVGGEGGLSPLQVRRAYGFDTIRLPRGVVGDGTGQTIALVTAYDHPTIHQDLQTFNRRFGLPAPPSFVQVSPQGRPPVHPLWALETALDVQWAHAMAPGANLLLVQARSFDASDMVAAVDYARRQPGVSVVSMSWGMPEFSGQAYLDSVFSTPPDRVAPGGITFVAASGDGGAASGPLWPAVSPFVVSVGGTQLRVDASGTYQGEVAWSGSGGGVSRYSLAPLSQIPLTRNGLRAVPDVAINASSASAVAVYSSVPYNGSVGWFQVSGTSAGAPQWAGLFAIANQSRALSGQGPLGNAVAALYALPSSAFRDITGGSNGLAATVGYDLATGRGTPIADQIVRGLQGPVAPPPPVRATATSTPAVVTVSKPSPTPPVTSSQTVLRLRSATKPQIGGVGRLVVGTSSSIRGR